MDSNKRDIAQLDAYFWKSNENMTFYLVSVGKESRPCPLSKN